MSHNTPCPESVTGAHMYVNYGTRSNPVSGCFVCGCTPTDPAPEAVMSIGNRQYLNPVSSH